METYTDAILVKIDEDRVVVINGEEYLVVDKAAFKVKEVKKERTWVKPDDIQTAILEVLKARPHSKSREIRHDLEKYYTLDPNPNGLRGVMTRMKNAGLIKVNGVKNAATWSIK